MMFLQELNFQLGSQMLTTTKKRGRPRKSAIKIGVEHSAKTQTRRLAKDLVNKTSLHPLAKVAIIGAIGAFASYFIKMK